MRPRRVVVTGLGVVSPVGIGADVAWDALVGGRSGITDHNSAVVSRPPESKRRLSGANARLLTKP